MNGRGPVDGASIVQKELNETIVRSREEIEERLETEDRQQLGDISDEVYIYISTRDAPTPEFHLRVPRIYTPHSLSPSFPGREKVSSPSFVPRVSTCYQIGPTTFSLCLSFRSLDPLSFPRPGENNLRLSAKADASALFRSQLEFARNGEDFF